LGSQYSYVRQEYKTIAVFYERHGHVHIVAASSSPWKLMREPKEATMNWDQIEGKWKQYAGKAKSKWGKLTDDDMTTLSGKKDQLVGLVQERYGIARDEAERQVDEFGNSFSGDNAAQRDENARRDKARGAGSV
jgi:uncharacterized protein YjbJ (UPF0337 family)